MQYCNVYDMKIEEMLVYTFSTLFLASVLEKFSQAVALTATFPYEIRGTPQYSYSSKGSLFYKD